MNGKKNIKTRSRNEGYNKNYFFKFYCSAVMMYFLMTNDVESFSIPLNREDPDVAKEVYEVGLPRLLELYARHDIKCTFYFTGMFAEQSPESVELVIGHGHEIGCHGYDLLNDRK